MPGTLVDSAHATVDMHLLDSPRDYAAQQPGVALAIRYQCDCQKTIQHLIVIRLEVLSIVE